MISSRYIRLAGHVECIIKESNGQIMLVGKFKERGRLGKLSADVMVILKWTLNKWDGKGVD
jgi:hypothetical protein